MELSGKLVVVTGAARGIGRALVMELAKSGCGLVLTALEEEELKSLEEELRKYSVSVASMPADLSDPASRMNLINWILSLPMNPDILINNAGIGGLFGKFEDVDLRIIEAVIAINISALVHITHELIPALKKRPRAKIVNISSGIARLPYPGLAVYGATKGFISSFSESLTCELAGTSVSVLCFHPGFSMTHFIGSSRMDMRKIPRWMIHTPEEIASRVVLAMRKDRQWDYSDLTTMLAAWLGANIPSRMKTRIFKNLFWRLPDAK
ncbi:MAG: SDR family NAD(P)-dependent oxidoreductase [Nitrospirae bacterium]|nr:SDR family NAD(P)-dependent oxidoreductase [Nitrospirota bacterium]MCL5422208.1 SDR family NAD(P)-dependent oxidoreductase [Nitrospirota bacterium]